MDRCSNSPGKSPRREGMQKEGTREASCFLAMFGVSGGLKSRLAK